MRMTIDRGERATYYLDETVSLQLEVDRECYVYVYNVDVRQRVNLVFPNHFKRDNLLQPGVNYAIPPPDAAWELGVVDEPGEERMVAIASAVPLEHTEAASGDIATCSDSLAKFMEKAVKVRLCDGIRNPWGAVVVPFFTLPQARPEA